MTRLNTLLGLLLPTLISSTLLAKTAISNEPNPLCYMTMEDGTVVNLESLCGIDNTFPEAISSPPPVIESEAAATFMDMCLSRGVEQGLSAAQTESICNCNLREFQARYSDDQIAQIVDVNLNPNTQEIPDFMIDKTYGQIILGCFISGGGTL